MTPMKNNTLAHSLAAGLSVAAKAPALSLPKWEALPPYMTPANGDGLQFARNVFPIGEITERDQTGRGSAYLIPLEFTGNADGAARLAALLNLPDASETRNARALLESLKGDTLTGDAARLALRLGSLLSAIEAARLS